MANIPDDRNSDWQKKARKDEHSREDYRDARQEGERRRNSFQDHDLVPDATAEIKAMAAEGMDHPSTKPVLTGAAVGAFAGWVLPVVGPIIGGVAGAGFMLYKRLRP
ncbi:hypothetical protein [Qipengyuania sphaerica]|uniref:hypothetical protein n=1 Tax=Qipengyuania sphaerica TaxID=2867243 RepID=UPI001C87C5A5|nr:hypothetical protein [Qipengyuania sphaerica]MBX7540791.1 hypothetical protein [Qipengyuania sphaerica]